MTNDPSQRYAEALAAKFTTPTPRCDRYGENEWVENPEPADRVEQTPRIVFTAGDGHDSLRTPTCLELGEVVAAVRDEELEDLRAELKTSEGRRDDLRKTLKSVGEERNHLREENVRLREALKTVSWAEDER